MLRMYAGMKQDDDNHDCICRALMLYRKMLCDGIFPNNLTFPFLLKECTKRMDEVSGLGIHSQVIKFGFSGDVFVGNSMINLYMACGLLNNAGKVFDEMPLRDIVTWNSMIIGFLRNNELDKALDLFRRMSEKNIITWNSIITGLVQGGRPKESLQLFHEMQVSSSPPGLQSSVSANPNSTCVAHLTLVRDENNCIHEVSNSRSYLNNTKSLITWTNPALVDDNMVKPDKITIASLLSACAQIGSIDHGKWVHTYLQRSGIECDVVIGTALVNMYGKCGQIDRAIEIFKEMPEKKDASAWTAMISVLALHGLAEKAFDCFREMEKAGIKPNHVTFVGLLSACAHSGLVEKAYLCFHLMKHVYSIEPQVYHYACMVDILSRARLFEEAERIIRSMPMKPDVYVWGSLLGGCQMHGNTELGEKVAWLLIDLEPQNHAFYMNLCDIYAKAGRFDSAKRVRNLMKERGIKKNIPGCSMIEINGVAHEFSAGESLKLPMEVVLVLDELSNQMKISL